jgi:hypothetical protein
MPLSDIGSNQPRRSQIAGVARCPKDSPSTWKQRLRRDLVEQEPINRSRVWVCPALRVHSASSDPQEDVRWSPLAALKVAGWLSNRASSANDNSHPCAQIMTVIRPERTELRRKKWSEDMRKFACRQRHIKCGLLSVFCAVGLFLVAGVAYSDVSISASFGSGGVGVGVSIFNYHECPAYQEVPIQRACFDQDGYQLYDAAGEAIVVPFADDNLYVMKFCVSPNGATYFVDDGGVPVLYLPDGGYLSNDCCPGGRWHPFTHVWDPYTPVYIGIAPSWHDWVSMGWYTNMSFYGGYWCNQPFISVGAVFPAAGLFINIGGSTYSGWSPYQNYYGYHPAPYRLTVINNNYYQYGGSNWSHYATVNHPFVGTGKPYVYGHGYVAAAERNPAIARRAIIAAAAVHALRARQPTLAARHQIAERTAAWTASMRTTMAEHNRPAQQVAANKTATMHAAMAEHNRMAARNAANRTATMHAAMAAHDRMAARNAAVRTANTRTAMAHEKFTNRTAAVRSTVHNSARIVRPVTQVHVARRSFQGSRTTSYNRASRGSAVSNTQPAQRQFRGASSYRPIQSFQRPRSYAPARTFQGASNSRAFQMAPRQQPMAAAGRSFQTRPAPSGHTAPARQQGGGPGRNGPGGANNRRPYGQ